MGRRVQEMVAFILKISSYVFTWGLFCIHPETCIYTIHKHRIKNTKMAAVNLLQTRIGYSISLSMLGTDKLFTGHKDHINKAQVH